eukprot:6159618-Ditylum_brightwellii.AAC.1
MDDVAWDSLEKALDQQHLFNQIRSVKFMHNWLNTGSQKKHFCEDTVDCCPACDGEVETWEHLFQCNHEDLRAV